jgi:hypothetical protein
MLALITTARPLLDFHATLARTLRASFTDDLLQANTTMARTPDAKAREIIELLVGKLNMIAELIDVYTPVDDLKVNLLSEEKHFRVNAGHNERMAEYMRNIREGAAKRAPRSVPAVTPAKPAAPIPLTQADDDFINNRITKEEYDKLRPDPVPAPRPAPTPNVRVGTDGTVRHMPSDEELNKLPEGGFALRPAP